MDAVVQALEGQIAPMECFHETPEGKVLCSHEDDGDRRLRDQAALDPGPGRRHQGAGRDHAGRAGRVLGPARSAHAAGASSAAPPETNFRNPETEQKLAELEIRNLHVSVEDKQILKGLDLDVEKGKVHALMGPERLRQVDARQRDHGPPGARGDRGHDHLQGRGHHRGRPRRPLPGGPLHGLPVPGRDPRRLGQQVPADDHQRPARGARRGRDQDQRLRQDRPGGDGAGEHPQRLLQPLPQRRLLRRREEADGAAAAGAAAAGDRGPRRDRLGPRHRRAADRRRGRQQVRRPRHGRPDHHPLPAHPAHGQARLRPRHVRGPDRQGRRPGAGRRARGEGLRLDPRGGRGGASA